MRYTRALVMAQYLEEVMIYISRIMLAVRHPRAQIWVTHTVLHLATVMAPAIQKRCLLVVTTLHHLKLNLFYLTYDICHTEHIHAR